ncbi:hypothetical protein EDB85DRAFT_2036919 [Lactarius pseudohatsudake]|nr:hypothetical protein EDB85DRAFT_2036919 [Lactarius pseudohatsudake]
MPCGRTCILTFNFGYHVSDRLAVGHENPKGVLPEEEAIRSNAWGVSGVRGTAWTWQPAANRRKVHKKLEISLTFDDEPDPIVTTLASPSSSATARSPPPPRDVAWLALLSLPTALRPYCCCPLARPLPSRARCSLPSPLSTVFAVLTLSPLAFSLSSFPYLHLACVVLPILLSSSSYDRSPCHISTLPDFPAAFSPPPCHCPHRLYHSLATRCRPRPPSGLPSSLRLACVAPPSPASARSPLLAAVLVALSSPTLALTTISLVSSLLFAAATTPTLP